MILTTVEAVGESIKVEYRYTEIMVLSVLWNGIINRPQPQHDRLRHLRRDLESESTGSVEVPWSAFVPAATPAKLLAIMGLHCHVQSNWRSHMSCLLKHTNLQGELSAPAAVLKQKITDEIRALAA
jgi:hypothetical protein